MSKNVVGVDISDFSIEAVVLDKKQGHFVVDTYSRFRLSPDIVEDGKIINPEKLKDALQRLFKNAQPKPIEDKRKVFLSIPESKVFTRILRVPKNLKEKEIYEAAAHKAEEMIPEAPENLVPAMKLLPTQGDDREVFYTEAEIEIVNDLVKIFKDLDIDIAGITSEAVSSFAGLDNDLKKEVTLMLDIGARTTIASVFDANGIRSSVNINIAGNNITSAIVKKMGITHAAAEDAKHKYGMTSAEDGGVMMIIQGQLQPLVDELKKFISYYQESSGQKIEQLVLIGGLAQMKGIDKYFGDNLNMSAEVGRAFIANDKLPDNMSSSKYINALGLAKLSFEKPEIDFYANTIKRDKKEKQSDSKNKSKAGQKSEQSSDSKSDAEPPFYKNKLFMVFLLVLILVGGFFVYKFVIQKKPTADIVDQQVAIPPKELGQGIEIVDGLKLTSEIIISDVLQEGVPGLLVGEEFEVRTEKTFQTDKGMNYDTAFNAMLDEIAIDVLAGLNAEQSKDGYYIVPAVIEQLEESSMPTEDEYVSGISLSAVIISKFLAVPENSIKAMLFRNLSSEQIEQVQADYNYQLDYEVLNKTIASDVSSINLKANMTLIAK